MWDSLPLWLGGIGGAGILGTFVALVRIAIGTERRRADDWRDAARTTAEANTVMNANVQKLVQSVEQLAASQRETTALLHTMTHQQTGPAA